MSDVHFCLALQALRCVAAGVECKLLGTTAQKSNAAPVSDAHKEVQVQSERVPTGEGPVTASVLIAELDFVRSTGDELAQFLTFKYHVEWGLLRCRLSRWPQGEGRNQNGDF